LPELRFSLLNQFKKYGDEGAVIPYEVKDGKVVLDFGDGELFYFKKAN
jgi:hypothetical protein